MIGRLKAPTCWWKGCSWYGREMKLLNEGDSFWFFHCECGCTRAISKPATREASLRQKYEQDIEEIRERQRRLDSRPESSFPSVKSVR